MKNYSLELRNIERSDFDKIISLNEESVQYTAPMDIELLESLYAQAEVYYAVEVDGELEGFAIGLSKGKIYDSINYNWFSEKYDNFIYIDRIVVSNKMQGKGIGEILYNQIFEYAKTKGILRITAEINIEPPNIVSLKFHQKFNFEEVGKHFSKDGKKLLSLQSSELR